MNEKFEISRKIIRISRKSVENERGGNVAIKVFIDTNIYETANFSFYNKQFSKLKELTEEVFWLLQSTDISSKAGNNI